MAPSAEVVSDLKPKALDFHDWRFGTGQNGLKGKNGHGQNGQNGQNGQYGRPILIRVEKSGKNSWSLKEVTPLKEDGTESLMESSSDPVLAPLGLLPESVKGEKGEKLGKGDKQPSLLASLSSSLSLSMERDGEPRLQKQKSGKQYAWLMLLQAHKAAGCLAWLGMGAMTYLRQTKKRFFAEKVSLGSALPLAIPF